MWDILLCLRFLNCLIVMIKLYDTLEHLNLFTNRFHINFQNWVFRNAGGTTLNLT